VLGLKQHPLVAVHLGCERESAERRRIKLKRYTRGKEWEIESAQSNAPSSARPGRPRTLSSAQRSTPVHGRHTHKRATTTKQHRT
jgi:hypothetical protein